MIDRDRLLADLKGLRSELEDDLRARCGEEPRLEAYLRAVHREAVAHERTAETYDSWRDEHLTQVAVAWILGCVFVRFLEDNAFVDPPRLSGPGGRRQRALDEHILYFRAHPEESDRDYLLHVFRAVAGLPVADRIFDEAHNPIWSLEEPGEQFRAPSGDAAGRLLGLWQRIDPDSGALVHDFTDTAWDTRFLGDLYQDLSESARKRYALLQTPEFVEEFILDRTLDPAVEEFGFREVRLIDPACGSGHFLLGAFRRLDALWAQHEPGTNPRDRASRVLDQVAGVDLNPFAVAIARFRLSVAALRAAGVHRLADAPAFEIHVATGDSLLHGPRAGTTAARQEYLDPEHDPLGYVYRTEDAPALRAILGRRYQVVIGNPPYITAKDKVLNQEYRKRFGSCHRKYSLAVPFTERFFDLAHAPATGSAAGFVGMITANSFMKREFGKKLIEKFIPQWDLTHAVDTSGASIPGHKTPTVILLGRHRKPLGATVRAVMGIRSERGTPEDPAAGRVWSAIIAKIDRPGSQDEFVSVTDVPRERLQKHPWTISGGGVVELKETLEQARSAPLLNHIESIGFGAILGEDDAFAHMRGSPWLRGVAARRIRPLIEGELVRDWALSWQTEVLFPYSSDIVLCEEQEVERLLWPVRTTLAARRDFTKRTYAECGRPYWEYHQIPVGRNRAPLSITFAFVATHNHFVLDRGGKVFNRSAPIINLPADATEDDHLGLVGLLNSSTACFWGRAALFPKGGYPEGRWQERLEWDGTKLLQFPVLFDRPLDLARRIDGLAQELARTLPASLVLQRVPSASSLHTARTRVGETRGQMIALQEELDWRCYRLYGVTHDDLCMPSVDSADVPTVRLGERAFEIVLARKMAAGEIETKWFERHSSTPITEVPEHWPTAYQTLVRRRIETIEEDANVAVMEQPEYKRRWNDEPWEEQQERALRGWLLDRLEAPSLWSELRLTTTAALADQMRDDAEFLQVAALYTERADFDVGRLVARLVEDESVPLLRALRYTPAGLRKRAAWERTWALQRMEDAIDARVALPAANSDRLTPEGAVALKAAEVGAVPVPPRYRSTDFRKGAWWRLRGKLDVPKERFVSLPGCERDADRSLVIGWAGWNALEQSRAVAGYFHRMREQEGWTGERLAPLLAALLELLPWVRQYHNAPDPEFDIRMGDHFEGIIEQEARALLLTRESLRDWAPPGRGAGRGRRRTE